MKIRITLGIQLLGGLAVVAIVVALLAGRILRQFEQDYLSANITSETEKIMDVLVSSTLDDLISEDRPQIETTMQQLIARDRHLFSVQVLNEKGVELFVWQRRAAPPDEKMSSFSRKVIFEGEQFGEFRLRWDTAYAYQEIERHGYLISVIVGGVCVVLSLLVFLVMDAFAIRPINRVSQRVQEFQEGKFRDAFRLPAIVSSELNHLNQSVNALGDFLKLKEQREEELQKAKEAAETATRIRTDFLANMSHELRTPLNGILGMAKMLLSTNQTVEQRRYAESLDLAGTVLLELVNDILDVSKMDAGSLDLEFSDFNIEKIARDVVGFLQPEADNRGLKMELRVSSELAGTVIGDPGRLRQILVNLVGNALKFTSAGSVCVAVTLDSEDGVLKLVRFAVTDTGIGVPEGDRANIFERFIQVDSSTKQNFGGTGLGLAICRQLVELMEGEIGLESEIGKGSTFWFTIPLVASAGSRPQTIPESSDNKSQYSGRRLRILVAEDNELNQMYLTTILRKGGHEVTITEDGLETVAAIKNSPADTFDVVLMDIRMPNMDGLEATKMIRNLPDVRSRVPIIAVTANAMAGDREHFLREGMNEYVSKPIEIPLLFSALAEVTGEKISSFSHNSGNKAAEATPIPKEAEKAMADFLEDMDSADDGIVKV